MNTPCAPKKPQLQRAEVRWPVTLLTHLGPIDGQIEYISISCVYVVSKSLLPSEGTIGLLIKASNNQTLHMTSEVVSRSVKDSAYGTTFSGAELQLTSMSENDKEFLRRTIATYFKNKTVRPAELEKITCGVTPTANTDPNSELDTSDAELPVSYKKDGKTVRANATRLSPKGCLVLTRKPHPAGTVFSLKITDTRSKKSIQLDGSVSARKPSASKKRWGMLV